MTQSLVNVYFRHLQPSVQGHLGLKPREVKSIFVVFLGHEVSLTPFLIHSILQPLRTPYFLFPFFFTGDFPKMQTAFNLSSSSPLLWGSFAWASTWLTDLLSFLNIVLLLLHSKSLSVPASTFLSPLQTFSGTATCPTTVRHFANSGFLLELL